MSKLVTIAQIRAMDVDDVIPAVSGTVTAIGKSAGGKGKVKSWTRQNFDLTQGKDTLRVVVWNRSEPIPENWKGKKVTVISTDQDSGITGVFAGDNDYQGKVTREIKVECDKGGEVTLGGSGSAGENADGAGQEAPAEKPHNPPFHNTAANPPANPPPAAKQPNPFAAGVFGGTVGMSMRLARESISMLGIPMFLEDDSINPRWTKLMWVGASAVIRICRPLEEGKLAPKPAVEPVKPVPSLIHNPPVAGEPVSGDTVPM